MARRTRTILVVLFVAALSLHALVLLLNRDAMWPEDLQAALLAVLSIYSVPLATILGGLFATRSRTPRAAPALCWAAIAVAGLWNALLLWRTLSFGMAAEDSVTDLVKYLQAVAAGGSFLLVGLLAYFFSQAQREPG